MERLVLWGKNLAERFISVAKTRDNRYNGATRDEQLNCNTEIQACIERGILAEFLRKNQVEVMDLLLTEYDEEAHIRGRDIFRNILMAVLLFIALGSGIALCIKFFHKSENTAALESISAMADQAVSFAEIRLEEDKSPETAQRLRCERLEEYAKLRKQNADMIGWINIPDTQIDYPVMQSPEAPDFYLKHNFEKAASTYGVPYVGERCDLSGGCNNIIVYGHHMKDGSMFTDLMKYEQESFYETHPFIYFDTMDTVGTYQIIGVLEVPAIETEAEFYQKMETKTPFDYSGYVAEVKRRSHYETGEIAVYGEQLLTLVTCEYTVNEGRFIMVAKKIR
ncbi:MAG: class B sortase [Hungatella sp.]